MRWPAIRAGVVAASSYLLAEISGIAVLDAAEPHRDVIRVTHEDALTRAHLRALMRQSPTARELMCELERTADVILTVRAHPLLVQQERVYGQGRFWVVQHRLYGLLEYQAEPVGSRRALRVIAHELGHALELGTSGRRDRASALRSFVLAREVDNDDDARSSGGVETEFARAIGSRVGQEICHRGQWESALDTIAHRFAVQLPQRAAPVAAAMRARK